MDGRIETRSNHAIGTWMDEYVAIEVYCFSAVDREPMQMSDFENHIQGMHENENHGFALEYSVKYFYTEICWSV